MEEKSLKKNKKSVDFLFELSIMKYVRYKTLRDGVIGSTADSDSVSRGSSPFSVAHLKSERKQNIAEWCNWQHSRL